jgi:glycosyltransferase involved in cell wall biosynthesis
MAAAPVTVAFLADYFVSWMGGAQLLANILNCLASVAPSQGVRVEVLMHARAIGKENDESLGDFLRVDLAGLRASGPFQCLVEGTALREIVFYRDLGRACAALGVRVIGPTGENLGRDFPLPWFGYVPDFQHQYLTHFFSQDERLFRDRQFRQVVENAWGVYVTSGAAAGDVERFYPGPARQRQVLRLPVALPRLDAIADLGAVTAAYGLQRPFFLSCSQRWLHKQHPLVLEAFATVVRRNPSWPLDLVFTGETSDHRDPGYSARVDARIHELGIADRVRVLGLVPRDHQLALVRLALAVVQASLFEGQAGASGTLEAALLGTRIIASDIATNRELAFGRQRYFDAASAEGLAGHLEAVVREVAASGSAEADIAAALPFDESGRQLLAMASGLQLISTLRAAAAA